MSVNISIIMPVYNSEKYLSYTLDSILASTYHNFELICVNDGSSDNSLNILNAYANKDNRIKIINQKNSGVSVARNAAFAQAEGKYIYYIDSDDLIHPQMLELCYNFAEQNNVEVLSFDFAEFKDNEDYQFFPLKIENIQSEFVEDFIYKVLSKADVKINYNIWSKFYRKDILKDIRFDENIKLCEDVLHTYMIAKKNPRTFILKNKLYGYRICTNSLSHGNYNVKQICNYRQCIEIVAKLFEDDEKRFNFLKQDFIPNILKHQLGRCRRAKKKNKSEMLKELSSELKWLDDKKLLEKQYHRKKRWKRISLLLNEKIFELRLFNLPIMSVNLDYKLLIGK